VSTAKPGTADSDRAAAGRAAAGRAAAGRAENERTVRLAASIAFRVSVVVLLVGLAAWWLYLVRDVLVTGFLALIIAAAIAAPVAGLERRGIRRVLAVVLVYLALIGVVVLMLALLVPPLVSQGRAFADDLPAIVGSLSDRVDALLAQIGLSSGAGGLDSILGQLGSVGGVLARVPGVVVGFLSALLLVTFLSALMILERDRARRWAMRFVAPADRAAWDGILRKAADRLGAYVRGQLLIMLVTGVGSYVGLTLIGVPFALPLGIFAFLTEAVPIAGPVISGAVMILVAFTQSPLQGLLTVGLVLLIQQAESLVLVPVIQGRLISISPVVALLAVLAGSAIGDIAGAILAIPLVAIVMVVIDDVILPWRRMQIGEEPASAPEPPDAAAEQAGT
jgi:predicted PurR-regulated permease PerM